MAKCHNNLSLATFTLPAHSRKKTKNIHILCGPLITLLNSLELYNETIRWENYDTQPRSICSERCPIGHVQNYQDQCCWSCVKCREEFEYVDNDTCISCEPGWAPNERRNGCNKLKAVVIDWLTPWAYVPLIFASAGILATIFTTAVFIK